MYCSKNSELKITLLLVNIIVNTVDSKILRIFVNRKYKLFQVIGTLYRYISFTAVYYTL